LVGRRDGEGVIVGLEFENEARGTAGRGKLIDKKIVKRRLC
jgi:hypothetical protein